MVFPEYFALLNDIYSKTTGKQIEDVSSQLRVKSSKLKVKQLQQDLAYSVKRLPMSEAFELALEDPSILN